MYRRLTKRSKKQNTSISKEKSTGALTTKGVAPIFNNDADLLSRFFYGQTRSLNGNSFLIGVVYLGDLITNATSEYIILIGNHGAPRNSE